MNFIALLCILIIIFVFVWQATDSADILKLSMMFLITSMLYLKMSMVPWRIVMALIGLIGFGLLVYYSVYPISLQTYQLVDTLIIIFPVLYILALLFTIETAATPISSQIGAIVLNICSFIFGILVAAYRYPDTIFPTFPLPPPFLPYFPISSMCMVLLLVVMPYSAITLAGRISMLRRLVADNLYIDWINGSTTADAVVYYFLMLLPCLLADFATFVMHEFSQASFAVRATLVIELAAIAMMWFPAVSANLNGGLGNLAKMIFGVNLFGGQNFLSGPDEYVGLNKSRMYEPKGRDKSARFAISFWLFINPPSGAIDESNMTQIFRYGSNPQQDSDDIANNINNNKHPELQYQAYYDKTDGTIKANYIFTFDDNSSQTFQTKDYGVNIPHQKWNNFVFNYGHNKTDLFVNGLLVVSIQRTNGGLSFDKLRDYLYVGSDKNRTSSLQPWTLGAVSNISFYPDAPLTETEILVLQKLFRAPLPAK